MSITDESKIFERRKVALETAIDNRYFFRDSGQIRATQGFLECFRKNWRTDTPMPSEELLYRAMLIIRKFSPNLNEPDFLAVRRIVWRFAFGEHTGWWKNHPVKEPRSTAENEKKLSEVKEEWIKGLKPEEKRDMLTLFYDTQLENAKKTIASGKNFMPELLMWRERTLSVAMYGPPDPMTQAIAAINQAKSEGYSFAAEAWRGLLKDWHKWGDLEKLESKVEAFTQVCAENDGPYLTRMFTVDREKALLIQDPEPGRSRMPNIWYVDNSPARKTDSSTSGAYA